MSFIQNQRRYLWLIIGSLILLTLFTLYWLYTVWSGFYKDIVHKEADYLLHKMFPYVFIAFLLVLIPAAVFVLLFRGLQRENRLGRLKNEYIGNISHELRSPIATIGIALEILAEDAQNSTDKKEYLDVSKLELERLSMMVDKVLRLSMFEEREPTLRMEPVDIGLIVRNVFKTMAFRAQKVQAELETRFPAENQYWVAGDAVHLSNVVFNLVDNALKYNVNRPMVFADIELLPERVCLRIGDNGVGVAPEFHHKIFEKFFRVNSVVKARGHGLGLSYVANVIRRTGGDIRVESPATGGGTGSVFILELPRTADPNLPGDTSR